MKKVILFAIAIMPFLPLNAQKTFDEELEIYSKLEEDFHGGINQIAEYQSSKIKLIDQLTNCLKAVKNEEQFIQVYDKKHVADTELISKSEYSYENDAVQLNESLVAKSIAFEKMLFGHKYYRQAIDFFNKNTPSISLQQPAKEREFISVAHFKKKLYDYTPAQLYWLQEFSGCIIDVDRADISRKEVDLAMKKIESSSLNKIHFIVLESD